MPERHNVTQSLSAAEIAAAAARLLGTIDQIHPLVPSGELAGSGGRSFLVVAAGRQFHLKEVPSASLRLLPLQDEYRLLQQLAPSEICPSPVAIDGEAGLIVCEFLTGYVPLTTREMSLEPNLLRLTSVLRRLHGLDVRLRVHSARSIAERYLATASEAASRSPEALCRAAEFRALADAFDRKPWKRVPCHGDIVAANVMQCAANDENGPLAALRLIDFEYAQRAPAVFDLATVSVMNDFAPADDERLLGLYAGESPPPFSVKDFATVRRLVALMAHYWALALRGAHPAAERYSLGGSVSEN